MLLFDELVKYNQQEAISNFWIKLPESDILIKLNSAVQSNVDFYRQILRMDWTTYYSRSNNAWGSALWLDIDNGEYTWICQQNWAIEQHVRLFDELTS